MKTVRHRERKNNLMETAKPKSQSWEPYVMSHYDIFKLTSNIQPHLYHYTKYLKYPFQRLMIITIADPIYQVFTV